MNERRLATMAIGVVMISTISGCAQATVSVVKPSTIQTTTITTSTPINSTPSPKNFMQLSSSAFQNNGSIPSIYTCDGKSLIPPLQISAAPANTKSLALIVHDPDAPRVGGFTHWVVWNIAPQNTTIAENTVPTGAVQGQNGAGRNQWMGPCPPSGTHHYEFMLYALDTVLELPTTTNMADLQKAMADHTLAQTTLAGLYKKQ